MANRLSMAKINAIQTLHQSGHSNRKIAQLLGVDRETVRKYVAAQNPPNTPTGAGKIIHDEKQCETTHTCSPADFNAPIPGGF